MAIFSRHHSRVDGHGTIIQDPHGAQQTVQAPEISGQGLIPAILLLLGAIAVILGKKRRGAQ